MVRSLVEHELPMSLYCERKSDSRVTVSLEPLFDLNNVQVMVHEACKCLYSWCTAIAVQGPDEQPYRQRHLHVERRGHRSSRSQHSRAHGCNPFAEQRLSITAG